MITYAGKFYDIAEYNDTFVVHLRLSCKKSHKKCFFLIYITIVRIDENKAYRHGGLYTSGRGQLIIFFYHLNTNTNRVSNNQSYLWKKVFKYTKTLFFNCVLQNTAGHKGLKNWSKSSNKISGKTINFLATVDNKQNEAKPYRKRPTIGFFPLDAFLRYYRMISVNAKKRRWGLEKAGDAYSFPGRPIARRGCL